MDVETVIQAKGLLEQAADDLDVGDIRGACRRARAVCAILDGFERVIMGRPSLDDILKDLRIGDAGFLSGDL